MQSDAAIVTEGRLRMSPRPSTELAAGALRAQEDAGINAGEADFLIVAVPKGAGSSILDEVKRVARLAPEPPRPERPAPSS